MKLKALEFDYSTYRPIGDKVFLMLPREDVNDMVMSGGVLVQKGAAMRDNPLRETAVNAVGPDCKQVKAGDTVLWNVLNSIAFPMGDFDLHFPQETHLICITRLAPLGHCDAAMD